MTLHLSQISLDLNSADARRDLSDPYDMHRTLCRAFIQDNDTPAPFLWCLEEANPGSPPLVLVQSAVVPAWENLPDGYLLQRAFRSWEPEAVIKAGQQIRFRVLANPTINRVPEPRPGQPAPTGPARSNRKRIGLTRDDEQLSWIQRKCSELGLIDVGAVVTSSGRIRCQRKAGQTITVVKAQFDGQALVKDPAALAAGIRNGIGRARMLGLGLVSVAPSRQ